MKKYLIAIGILIFLLITIVVMSSTDSKKVKRVRFTNEKIVISNAGAEVGTQVVEVKTSGTKVQKVPVESAKRVVKIENKESSIDDLTFRREYKSNKTSQTYKYQEDLDNYNNQLKKLDKMEKDFRNHKSRGGNNFREAADKYLERNIDWNTWKSNFINRILDDSVYISALDEYGLGAWFYYSFDVHSDGSISNIKVYSWYLNAEDKEKVVKLIKSYAYKPITKFPLHTKKKNVKVDAAVLLGSTEKRANPSDFNENERVKIKY